MFLRLYQPETTANESTAAFSQSDMLNFAVRVTAAKDYDGKRADISGYLYNVDFKANTFLIGPYVEFTSLFIRRSVPDVNILCEVEDHDQMNMLHGMYPEDPIRISGTIKGREGNTIIVEHCSISMLTSRNHPPKGMSVCF